MSNDYVVGSVLSAWGIALNDCHNKKSCLHRSLHFSEYLSKQMLAV